MTVAKIAQCTISPQPKGLFDPIPIVSVVLDTGLQEELFSYYPDEISFQPDEFIGLTIEQAHALRHQRDVAYLQS